MVITYKEQAEADRRCKETVENDPKLEGGRLGPSEGMKAKGNQADSGRESKSIEKKDTWRKVGEGKFDDRAGDAPNGGGDKE